MRVAPFLAVLLLAACATRPPVAEARQEEPLARTAFRVAAVGPGGLSRAERLAMQGLEARGLRAAEADQPADYVVQVAHADRARKVGAFIPTKAGEPQWLARDSRRWTLDRGAATLAVRIVEASSGREAYAARVSHAYRRAPGEAKLPQLVAAALAPLKVATP